jgi:hypothetical protein
MRRYVILPVSQDNFLRLAGRSRDRKLAFVLPGDADVLESSDPEHDAPVFHQEAIAPQLDNGGVLPREAFTLYDSGDIPPVR